MRVRSGLFAALLVAAVSVSGAVEAKDKPGAVVEGGVEVMVPAETVTGYSPGSSSDYDLENIIYAAYRAARESALVNDNYFIYGDVTADDIRLMIIRDLVKTGYTGVTIAFDEAEDFSSSRECAAPGRTELRLHYTADGIGMSLVAVNETRYAAYDYDPSISSELVITPPSDCLAPSEQSVSDKESEKSPGM